VINRKQRKSGISSVEYYSSIRKNGTLVIPKNNEILLFAATWVSLKHIGHTLQNSKEELRKLPQRETKTTPTFYKKFQNS
jgi:hypothetical protein